MAQRKKEKENERRTLISTLDTLHPIDLKERNNIKPERFYVMMWILYTSNDIS